MTEPDVPVRETPVPVKVQEFVSVELHVRVVESPECTCEALAVSERTGLMTVTVPPPAPAPPADTVPPGPVQEMLKSVVEQTDAETVPDVAPLVEKFVPVQLVAPAELHVKFVELQAKRSCVPTVKDTYGVHEGVVKE